MRRHKPEAGEPPKRVGVVEDVRMAGEDHCVVSVRSTGQDPGYRKKPCAQCPWRVDATGVFPPDAFRHSAATSYDMSDRVFACHESGIDVGKTCAGFLLRNADNNLAIRLRRIKGQIVDDVSDAGLELHGSYRDMAVANGVPANDPVLARCRSNLE